MISQGQLSLLQKAYGLAAISLIIWFANNITTVILNKIIYTSYRFPFPLCLTAVHMFVCSLGSFLVLRVFGTVPYQPIASNYFWQRIFPLSFIFILNIIMGNISLNHIPVSFMQTVKSSVPAFTVLLETIVFSSVSKRHDAMIYWSLVPIVGGIMFASYTEVNFEMVGFLTAVAGSIFTALQTIVSSIVMTQKLNAINLTYYMAPPSFLLLLPFCYYYEYEKVMNWEYLGDQEAMGVLFLSGAIAFALNISTFYAIHNTSPLTFTIAGNFKVILSITFSVMVFKNTITPLNAFGCGIALLGVAWYNQIRYKENMQAAVERQAAEQAKKAAEAAALAKGETLEEKEGLGQGGEEGENLKEKV